MAIFGIVLASVLKVFSLNYQSYTVQEEVAATQQNVRVVKMFLERDVRMAGCGLRNFHHEDKRVYALEFDNNSTAGDTGSDKLTITYIDYDVGACGAGAPSCDDLPPLTLKVSMPKASAVATVEEEFDDSPYDLWTGNCDCNGDTYGTPPYDRYKAIITSPDGSKSDVVYITQVINSGGGTDDMLQNHNYAGFDNKVLNNYPAGSTIEFFNEKKLVEVVYHLDNRILRRNNQPVAENIEDLQFAFGLDTNTDGIVDSGEWMNNADLIGAQPYVDPDPVDQIRSVRISVLGRTANEDRNCSGNRPAIEDHAASGTSDGYHRKLLQVTVKVRNLGL